MRFLVTGAEGQLGHDLVDALSGSVPPGGLRAEAATGRLGERPACDVTATDYRVLDVCDRDAVLAAMEGIRPDVVVHAAAWTAVDACEADPDRAFAVNSLGTRNVAEAARRFGRMSSTSPPITSSTGRPLAHTASGTSPVPCRSTGTASSEESVNSTRGQRSCAPRGCAECTARTWSVPFCAWPRPVGHFDSSTTSAAHRRSPPISPGPSPLLATERMPGIFHVTNQGATTWHGFAAAVLEASGDDPTRVLADPDGRADPAASRSEAGQLGPRQRRVAAGRDAVVAGVARRARAPGRGALRTRGILSSAPEEER